MRARRRTQRYAFTLIELMVVIVIIGVLVALLLPVITGAVRTAKAAAVTAEFQTIGAALEAFKARHGEYPPSRVMLCEDGYWNTSDATMIPVTGGVGSDITHGQLAQRSVAAIRKYFPQVPLSTDNLKGPVFNATTTWFDFDGDGEFDPSPTPGRGVILSGPEALCFWLGGIPLDLGTTGDSNISLSGFARGRVAYPASVGGRQAPNPFRNNLNNGLASNLTFWGDREEVGYEFKPERLVDADGDGHPEYLDSLGTGKPIAYFRAEAQGYDPNDCNIPEPGFVGTPAVAVRKFRVPSPVVAGADNTNREAISPGPNPYTSSLANTGSTVAWHRQVSFQLISAGADGLFGIGGAWQGTRTPKLPPEGGAANTNDPDTSLRVPEHDNLTNFASGTLE